MQSTKFQPQHKQKCYCQKNCVCDNKLPFPQTSGAFVKVRGESGHLKPRCERIAYSTGPSSRSTSKCSTYHYHLDKDKTKPANGSVLLKSRRTFVIPCQTRPATTSAPTTSSCYHQHSVGRPSKSISYLETLDDNKIEEIKQFRLQNMDECFSFVRQSIVKKDLEKRAPHTCQLEYKLNKRGLLEAANEGKCSGCGKQPNQASIVPAQSSHSIKIVIDEESAKSLGSSSLLSRPAKNFDLAPTNSLALIYQQRV